MTHIRVQPDDGPPVTLLPEGSRITDEDTVEDLLGLVIAKLRTTNRATPAREISLAITHTEEASHWLDAFSRKATR